MRIPIKKVKKIPVISRKADAIVPGLQEAYKPYYRLGSEKSGIEADRKTPRPNDSKTPSSRNLYK